MGNCYPHSISIKRKTVNDLGDGAFSETYEIVYTNVPANVQEKKLSDFILADRKTNTSAYNCYVKPTQDILGTDIIVYDGDEYNIVSRGKWQNAYIKCYMEQIV